MSDTRTAWTSYDSLAPSKPKPVVPESSVTGAVIAGLAVGLFALIRWRAARATKNSLLCHIAS